MGTTPAVIPDPAPAIAAIAIRPEHVLRGFFADGAGRRVHPTRSANFAAVLRDRSRRGPRPWQTGAFNRETLQPQIRGTDWPLTTAGSAAWRSHHGAGRRYIALYSLPGRRPVHLP